MWHRGACHQQRAEHIDVKLLAIQRFAALFNLRKLIHTGIVHHDVQPAKLREGRLNECLNLRLIGDIRCQRHRRATGGLNSGDHLIRPVFIRGIVDDDLCAVGGQLAGNCRANAFRCAGYEGDFVLKLLHVLQSSISSVWMMPLW